jgi:hypothetical protein
MSVISIEVRGILDLKASAEILCPTTRNVLGHLSLQQTLMKYLKLQDGNPMCTKLHQRRPQGSVDMVIPNTSVAEACFKMFNKQPAGYLYHVLPTFGASPLFIKNILHQLMEAGLMTEAPLCTYDPEMQILTTPQEVAQDGILSDVCSLPFFQDVLADKQAADDNKNGKKKKHSAPKMCFQTGSACSVQTVHGSNDGKYSKVTEPGVDLSSATPASAAKPSNADQPVIKVASTDDDASSSEESEEGSNSLSSSDNMSALTSSEEEEQSVTPAGSRVRTSPPPSTTGGAKHTGTSSGVCEVAGSVKHWQNQQCACHFRNLCESTRRIKLIDEYGTRWYIKQRGGLSVTLHQTVLTALEQRALHYQNSKTYEELEDKRLLDEAINKTGTVPCANIGGDKASPVNVEEQLIKEIREVLDYLLEVHGVPPGRKGEGITRLIYENLNGLQSTLLIKNEKLEKARRVINELKVDIVCYNEHRQNLQHQLNRNGFRQMFNGGETELRAIALNNVHKEVGKFQEGGMAMMTYGNLIQQFDPEGSGRDNLGLGC